MSAESKSFPQPRCDAGPAFSLTAAPETRRQLSTPVIWLQTAIGFGFIEAAVWTPGPGMMIWTMLASISILLFTLGSGHSVRELGLAPPSVRGTAWILAGGVALATAIVLTSLLLGHQAAAIHWPHAHGLWQYTIWAVVQQFILQSFFYVRLESALGGRPAVLATAVLFAAAHIPSPVLMGATLLGGLFFCEMFRRHRSILPLGMVHALLGLTMAATFSDATLHHMRVGIGYLHYH